MPGADDHADGRPRLRVHRRPPRGSSRIDRQRPSELDRSSAAPAPRSTSSAATAGRGLSRRPPPRKPGPDAGRSSSSPGCRGAGQVSPGRGHHRDRPRTPRTPLRFWYYAAGAVAYRTRLVPAHRQPPPRPPRPSAPAASRSALSTEARRTRPGHPLARRRPPAAPLPWEPAVPKMSAGRALNVPSGACGAPPGGMRSRAQPPDKPELARRSGRLASRLRYFLRSRG